MSTRPKRDLSISLLRANLVAFGLGIPVAIVQLKLFVALHGAVQLRVTLLNGLLWLVILLVSVGVHELIHGLTWMWVGKKSAALVTYGVQWQTLTPFAHLNGPVEVNAYRIGGLMPGLVLGLIPYLLSLLLGDGNLLWFGILHTVAAGGDWLVLWLIRTVKRGALVEDHPTRVGCFVLEG
jgi:hypothetical protein